MRKTNNPLYHPNQKEDMEECEKENKVSKARDNNIHNLSTNHLHPKMRKTNNPVDSQIKRRAWRNVKRKTR